MIGVSLLLPEFGKQPVCIHTVTNSAFHSRILRTLRRDCAEHWHFTHATSGAIDRFRDCGVLRRYVRAAAATNSEGCSAVGGGEGKNSVAVDRLLTHGTESIDVFLTLFSISVICILP